MSAAGDLIKKLGGPSAVAIWCGQVTADAVSAWGLRNTVPWKWRTTIAAMANAKGIRLNAADRKVISLNPDP